MHDCKHHFSQKLAGLQAAIFFLRCELYLKRVSFLVRSSTNRHFFNSKHKLYIDQMPFMWPKLGKANLTFTCWLSTVSLWKSSRYKRYSIKTRCDGILYLVQQQLRTSELGSFIFRSSLSCELSR